MVHTKEWPTKTTYSLKPGSAEARLLNVDPDIRYRLIEQLVRAIANDIEDRNDWIGVAHAIKGATGSDWGEDLWLEFCARWTKGSDDEDEDQIAWDSIYLEDGKAGINTLLKLARRADTPEAIAAIEAVRLAQARAAFDDQFDNPPDDPDPPIDPEPDPKPKAKARFRPLAEFIAEYKPIADVVDGLLSLGCLYTLTATTGTGKTALLSATALAIGAGRNDILGREVMKGRAAFSTAENPDGLKMRLGVSAFYWNIDPTVIGRNVLVSDTRVSPEAIYKELKRDAQEHGPFVAVFIDTWQAFFDGRDSSKPVEAVEFTRRFRRFAYLPGNPAVILATHPVKNASNTELIPYGGGSILNEIDGNFTLSRQPSGLIALGWQGKLRGLDFEPPLFRIDHKTSPGIVNVKGELVEIPVMLPTSQAEVENREAAVANRDVRVLRAVDENPRASIRELETAARVTRGTLQRALNKLAKAKPALVGKELDKWVSTKAGKEALKAVPI
jgi:hypothetical protein